MFYVVKKIQIGHYLLLRFLWNFSLQPVLLRPEKRPQPTHKFEMLSRINVVEVCDATGGEYRFNGW